MAIVTHECPHCRTSHIGLRVAAILAFDAHRGAVHFDCPKCNQPSCAKSRLRKFGQDAKWSFCLTAGTIGPRIRRDYEQTSPPESLSGLQGEGGAGSLQGRPDDSPIGRAFRRPPQSDYGVEIAA